MSEYKRSFYVKLVDGTAGWVYAEWFGHAYDGGGWRDGGVVEVNIGGAKIQANPKHIVWVQEMTPK